MTTFVQIQGANRQLVWVNPELVRYVRADGANTMLYFDKDHDELLLGEPVATVLALLQSNGER